MSLQKLILNIKMDIEAGHASEMAEDILKLCQAAEVMRITMENAKKDLDDLDTSLMADYKIVMSGCSRAKLAITISQNEIDQICKE